MHFLQSSNFNNSFLTSPTDGTESRAEVGWATSGTDDRGPAMKRHFLTSVSERGLHELLTIRHHRQHVSIYHSLRAITIGFKKQLYGSEKKTKPDASFVERLVIFMPHDRLLFNDDVTLTVSDVTKDTWDVGTLGVYYSESVPSTHTKFKIEIQSRHHWLQPQKIRRPCHVMSASVNPPPQRRNAVL